MKYYIVIYIFFKYTEKKPTNFIIRMAESIQDKNMLVLN